MTRPISPGPPHSWTPSSLGGRRTGAPGNAQAPAPGCRAHTLSGLGVVSPCAMHTGDGARMMPDGRHLTHCGSFTRVMTIVRVTLVLGGTAAYLGLASLGARPSVQGAGRNPAGAHAGHQWCLGGHPPPQLSGNTRQRAGVGPGFSCGDGRAAHGAHDPAAPRAHLCGRAAATHAVWR